MSRLPVDYDRFQYDRIEFSPRDWDQTPRVSTTREIERLMPDISRLVANEVTACADMNDLRCAMFNLMAEKEFENREFEDLCQFVADFIEFRVECHGLTDPSRGLEDSIVNAVRFYCAGLMDRFRELRDIVDADRNTQTIRTWDVNLGQYRELCEAIEDMHNQDQRDLRSRGSSRAYDRGQDDDRRYARDDRGSRDRDTRRGRDERDSRRRRQQEDHLDGNGRYSVRASTDGPSAREERDTRRSYRRDRDEPRSNNPAFDPSDFVATKPVEQTRTEVHHDPVTDIIEQHRLTPNPVEPAIEDTMFIGEFGPIPLLVPKGTSEMDLYKHAMIYGKGIANAPDMSEEIRRVFTASQAVKETNVTSENLEPSDIVVDTDVELFSTVSGMCESISNTSTATMVANAGENKDGRRQIFHKAAAVSNAFIGHPHLTDFHSRLIEQTSFDAIVLFLKRAVAVVNVNASSDAAYATDIRAAAEYYDRWFADEVSNYCQNVLGMQVGDPNQPLITSVINDYDALMEHFMSSGQDRMRNAVAALVTNLVMNISHGWEIASGVKSGIDQDVESLKETETTMLGSSHMPVGYIVTHLPFTMKEMGYDITKPVAIPDDDVSNFLKAALDISGTDLISEEHNPAPIRLVVARDRKVFRIYRYPGNGRAMILSPVRNV